MYYTLVSNLFFSFFRLYVMGCPVVRLAGCSICFPHTHTMSIMCFHFSRELAGSIAAGRFQPFSLTWLCNYYPAVSSVGLAIKTKGAPENTSVDIYMLKTTLPSHMWILFFLLFMVWFRQALCSRRSLLFLILNCRAPGTPSLSLCLIGFPEVRSRRLLFRSIHTILLLALYYITVCLKRGAQSTHCYSSGLLLLLCACASGTLSG